MQPGCGMGFCFFNFALNGTSGDEIRSYAGQTESIPSRHARCLSWQVFRWRQWFKQDAKIWIACCLQMRSPKDKSVPRPLRFRGDGRSLVRLQASVTKNISM